MVTVLREFQVVRMRVATNVDGENEVDQKRKEKNEINRTDMVHGSGCKDKCF